jgi:putative spermidine/putrescine transport system permease protein
MAAIDGTTTLPDAAVQDRRPNRKPRRNTFWSWLWIVLGALYFLIPLVGTFIFSLRAKKDVLSFLAYQQVFEDPQFYRTFTFSFEMAIFTILVSLVLVVPTAYWIRLKLPKLRILVEFISLMPFVIPAIVLVFGLIRVFSGAPFQLTSAMLGNIPIGTYTLVVAGYVVLALPYMFRAVDTGLQAIDVRSLTEAAQSLGAGWAKILFQIIVPNLRVALLSGAFLTLATVMGEFTIATFLVGINAFGPYISQTGQNKAYESASLAIISFLLTWISMLLIQYFSRGRTDKSAIVAAH